ncbi:MAG: MarR family transcriptional regulator [Rhizobiaceae bacterium]
MTGIVDSDSLAKTRLRLWLKLLKTTNHIEARLREKLRSEFDTTLPRFDVMAALSRFPNGLKMSQLSGVLKVSNGNVTGIIDRLVVDGFVTRSPVPGDRRAWRVHLTSDGRQEFDRQASAHARWVDDLLAGISPREAEMIIADLTSVTGPSGDDAHELGLEKEAT